MEIGIKAFSKIFKQFYKVIDFHRDTSSSYCWTQFFIDHGAGLVIGETSTIGNNVTMYQQTTLGGLSPSIDSSLQRNTKRHPTLKDNVIVGSGAQVLGPVVIGENSRIGANAVVLNDVPSDMTFVGIPARKIQSDYKKEVEHFEAYGISKGKIDDPNKKSINALFKEIHILNEKISELQNSIQNQKNSFGFQLKQNVKRKRKVKRG